MSGKAVMPVILRGDTARGITLSPAPGYDYGGCTLEVELNGARRAFDGLAAGEGVTLDLTAEETARMPLGAGRVHMRLRNAAGEVLSLPWAKVKVTDAPGEVRAAAITIDPATLDVEDATAGDSLGDVKGKLNAVLAFLRGVAVLAASALPCMGSDVAPLYTTPNDMPGDAPLMTNAAEYVDAKVSSATNGLLREESDPAFTTWTNGTEVAAGAGAAASHESVAIGMGANAVDETAPMHDGAVAVGPASAARGHSAVAVGKQAKATDAESVAIGPFARSHGPGTFSVHADGPEKFYLGDRSLSSFLDGYASSASVAATVTNVVRDVVRETGDLLWDEELQVTWKATFKGGCLWYTPVTNVNITGRGE